MNEQYTPKRCVFECTLACNLSCRHCGSLAGEPRSDELSTAEAADLFEQLAKLGCEQLTLSGGEPLCRDDWPTLIEASARTGMKTGMISNGLVFDETAARRSQDSGLSGVAFSLDGLEAEHDFIRGKIGHFAKVIRAVDAAQDAGLRVGIITVVRRKNLGSLPTLHELLRDKGMVGWQVQLGTDMVCLRENRSLLLSRNELPRLEETLASLIDKGGLPIQTADTIGYFSALETKLRTDWKSDSFTGCKAGISLVGIESTRRPMRRRHSQHCCSVQRVAMTSVRPMRPRPKSTRPITPTPIPIRTRTRTP